MEDIIKTLECVEVTHSENGKKVTLTFLDEETGEVRDVNYNQQSYDSATKKYVDDEKKKESIDKMIADDLGLTFETIDKAQGMKKDVYCYDTFSSLHKVDMVESFTEDMKGQIYQTEIKEIIEDAFAIKIRYEIDDKLYESKMTHGKYLDGRKCWASDPVKKKKQYERFEEKFLVPVSDAESLVGHPIMVECKSAFGKFYGDVKAFPKPKKK